MTVWLQLVSCPLVACVSGMSLTAAQLEQRYGVRLRQEPFSGASSARILFRMIEQQLPACKVSEGMLALNCNHPRGVYFYTSNQNRKVFVA